MKSANALRLAHWGKPVSQAQAGRGGGGEPGQGPQQPGHAGPLLSLFHANGEGAEGGGQQRRHSRRAKRGRHPPSLPSQPGPLTTDPPVEFKVANEGREEASQTGCKYPRAPSAAAGTGTDPRFVRGSAANAACGCRHTPVFVRVVPVEPATLPHPGKSPNWNLSTLSWAGSRSLNLPGCRLSLRIRPNMLKMTTVHCPCSTDRYRWQNQTLWSD